MEETLDAIVVGGGPCGLVALKEMKEQLLKTKVFEKSSTIGGYFANPVFSQQPLTITNRLMAFSDFESDIKGMGNWMQYPTAEIYNNYLQQYATEFNLYPDIVCNAEVENAALTNDDSEYKWRVVTSEGHPDTRKFYKTKSLIVATGANQYPMGPPRSLDGFTGKVIGIRAYDKSFEEEVADKNWSVLVLGAGETGADVGAELANIVPGRVAVSIRHPIVAGGRFQNPFDEMTQLKDNWTKRYPVTSFLETYVASNISANVTRYFRDMMLFGFWNLGLLQEETSKMCLSHPNPQAAVITKGQRMFEAWHNKTLQVIEAPVMTGSGKTVTFTRANGETETREYDAVVLCTGYNARFPWLRVNGFEEPNPRDWFLHSFPPGLGHCLSFVGYARPQQGGIPAMAEILSRYIAQIRSGLDTLPRDYAVEALRAKASEIEYFSETPELGSLVDYNAFIESVARRIGCEPKPPTVCIFVFILHMLTVSFIFVKVFGGNVRVSFQVLVPLWLTTFALGCILHDGFLPKWWFVPRWPVWYRQRGPGARPELLKSRLASITLAEDVNFSGPLMVAISCMVLALYAQRFMCLLLFIPHQFAAMLGVRYSKTFGSLLRPRLYSLHSAIWRISDLYLP